MKRRCFPCVALLVAVASGAAAQVFRGATGRTVNGSSGAGTPGATVTAVDLDIRTGFLF